MEDTEVSMNKVKLFFGLLLALSITGLLIWYGKCYRDVKIFNKNEQHSYLNIDSEYVDLSISERTGQSDSWQKPSPENDSLLTSKIYDISINKTCPFTVENWTLRINIKKKMYLNNSWCGTVEIHQFDNGTELSQTVDLRALDTDRLSLKHFYDGQDVLIPLEPGDYLIYHPNESVYEMPIISEHGAPKEITIGYIFYYEDTIDLSDVSITYHITKKMTETPEYRLFFMLLLIWCMCALLYATILITMFFNKRTLNRKEKMIEESLTVFSNFVDAKDPYTNGHSKRVAEYSKLIAEKLKMSKEECNNVYYIALMHDCGKCKIPDSILKKPDKLTPEEYDIIKSHTTEGANMLKNFSSISNFSDGALYHHERYDGKGYPMGISGNDIPLIGRIICVADSFDTMAYDRVYRNSYDISFIRNEIINCSGKQFDPELVDIFIKLIDSGAIKPDIGNPS